jgi:arylsulfatase A-like enzyme
MRRAYATLAAVILILGCMQQQPAAPIQQKQAAPGVCGGCNVVLITIDALRADRLGSYGYVRNTTPNIDFIAGKAVRFEWAFAQWPKTSQSVATMMTSRYPGQTGVTDTSMSLPSEELTLAEILKQNGYRSAGFITNSNLGKGFNFDQGFEEYHELWKSIDAEDSSSGTYTADKVNELLIPWVRDNASGRFFLWVHYIDPHEPFRPLEGFDAKFVNDSAYRPGKFIESDDPNYPPKHFNGTRIDVEYQKSQYDGEVAFADKKVGELMHALDAKGLLNNTVVIVTADHGESLDEHNYYFAHGDDLYTASTRVPLLISYPGVKAQTVSDPVGLIDLMPTILDIVGISPNGRGFSGQSLMAEVPNEWAAPEYIYSESRNLLSVVHGSSKLIMTRKGETVGLFDYVKDPQEKSKIKDDKLLEEMNSSINSWAAKTAPSGNISSGDVSSADNQTLDQLKALGYV